MDVEKKEGPVKAETLEIQLKEWGIDIEKLKFKASKTREDARTEIDREVAALRAKFNEAQKKVEELKTAGDAASVELKKGAESAWAELKKGLESATAKFKS